MRAAAAVAVGKELDDEGRARLRVAAEGIAAPDVRVAIERAAEAAPDEDVESAMQEVARQEERAEKARSR